ncbi:MAG: 2-polyprenyl-3-methyl-6-methoxy-1,4-benzoquinone monooxygenase [Gammaproteobacteria bacterium]|nr:2-polyprenyl-3-methyl-6-methoxy-1,4-benzoquinone monooxygenase [Gammaproteobacteria bacterium]
MRPNSFTDHCIAFVDTAVRTVLHPQTRIPSRPNPAEGLDEASLSTSQKQHIANLMRVNHAGEVSAQALYQGQALTAKKPEIRDHLQIAADEEVDHLAWCEQRLTELDAHTSLLAPLWYSSSFVIGALAGLAGDKISLGFLAETERQVTRHLHSHLERIPPEDQKTQAILKQMAIDENNHALAAFEHGGTILPEPIRALMRWGSRLLTTSSYYL